MISCASKAASAKILIASALMLGTASVAGAYTAEQEQMCTGDAMRLCSAEIPNVDAVTACMVRLRAQLSPGCKAVFEMPAAAAPVNYSPAQRAGKPVNLVPPRPKRAGA